MLCNTICFYLILSYIILSYLVLPYLIHPIISHLILSYAAFLIVSIFISSYSLCPIGSRDTAMGSSAGKVFNNPFAQWTRVPPESVGVMSHPHSHSPQLFFFQNSVSSMAPWHHDNHDMFVNVCQPDSKPDFKLQSFNVSTAADTAEVPLRMAPARHPQLGGAWSDGWRDGD